ncbi:hypothetical protein EIN_249460 [Entamoeba invadens IP1]|uniref:Uncharacterized protein n=1 Tax=Entamoeba invadens IP1 TaxID=370355 RepID=A0A0A1UH89_ENTIV|nr:hypothetical protein EIN_249460 [Entamoeba invadens IP1]ELP94902.1 hypothetical protein EIN_249460 [Entamoeba invadens IP1]|eukprot:XP_004261673.1 hypothetical protein EIN_249460 [Entamoeba invadens IP1]
MQLSYIEVVLPVSATAADLVLAVSAEMRRNGMTLNEAKLQEANNLTVKQIVEEGRLICLMESVKVPTAEVASPKRELGSCHCCKTRKEVIFQCTTSKFHRLCGRCSKKFAGVVGCPICNGECTCAHCKRTHTL